MAQAVYSSLLWAMSWLRQFIRVFCGPCRDSSGLFESSVGLVVTQEVYSSLLWAMSWLRRFIRVFCGPCRDSGGLFESSVGLVVTQAVYSSLLWAVSWLRWFCRVFCGLCHASGGYSPVCNHGVFLIQTNSTWDFGTQSGTSSQYFSLSQSVHPTIAPSAFCTHLSSKLHNVRNWHRR